MMTGSTKSRKAHYEENGNSYDLKYTYNETGQGYWIAPNPAVANAFFVSKLETADSIIISCHRVKRHVNE